MKKTMKHLPTLVAMVLFSALAIAAGLPPSGSGVASVEPITLDTVNVRVGINDTTPDHPFDVEVGGEEQLRVESDGDVCLDDDGGSCTLRVDAANNFVYTQTLLPRLDDTYYLGTAGAGWRGLRLSANGAITFGDGTTQISAANARVAVNASGTSFTANHSTITTPIFTELIDTHAAYNPATSVFTVPVAGDYLVDIQVVQDSDASAAASGLYMELAIDGLKGRFEPAKGRRGVHFMTVIYGKTVGQTFSPYVWHNYGAAHTFNAEGGSTTWYRIRLLN